MPTRSRYFLLAALAAAAVALLGACGSSAPFAARVDGRTISQDALEDELRAIASNERYLAVVEEQLPVRGLGQGTFDSAFTAQVLSRQIVYSMVSAELSAREVRVTDADRDLARPLVVERVGGDAVFADFSASYRRELVERSAELNVLTVSLLGQGSLADAARASYESDLDAYTSACVRHVLLQTPEKAAEVKARLDAGDAFASVARAESADALSAPQGGDLGCGITRTSRFVPEFLAAVFSQEVGQVGEPVETSFGYHVIEVTSRNVPPYEQVASTVAADVVAGGQSELRRWLERAVSEAEISVDPKYGTFRKAGASSEVVPPGAPALAPATPVVPGG